MKAQFKVLFIIMLIVTILSASSVENSLTKDKYGAVKTEDVNNIIEIELDITGLNPTKEYAVIDISQLGRKLSGGSYDIMLITPVPLTIIDTSAVKYKTETVVDEHSWTCSGSEWGYFDSETFWCNTTHTIQNNQTLQNDTFDTQQIVNVASDSTEKDGVVTWTSSREVISKIKEDKDAKIKQKVVNTIYGDYVYYIEDEPFEALEEKVASLLYKYGKFRLKVLPSSLPVKYTVCIGQDNDQNSWFCLDPTITSSRTWTTNADFINGTILNNMTTSNDQLEIGLETPVAYTPLVTPNSWYNLENNLNDEGTYGLTLIPPATSSNMIFNNTNKYVGSYSSQSITKTSNGYTIMNSGIGGSSDWAIGAWYYVPTVTSGIDFFVGLGENNTDYSCNCNNLFFIHSSGQTIYYSQAGVADRSTGVAFVTNAWHHYIVSKQGSNIKIYSNGTQIYSSGGDINSGFGDDIMFLRHVSYPDSQGTIGLIDNIYIINRTLTADDIVQMMNRTVTQQSQATQSQLQDRQSWTPVSGNTFTNISAVIVTTPTSTVKFRYNSTNASLDTSAYTTLSTNGTNDLTFNLNANDPIFYEFMLQDTSGSVTPKISSYTINEALVNTAPTIAITNDLTGTYYTNTNLSVNVTPSDVDGDTLSVTAVWYKNNVGVYTQTKSSIANGTLTEFNLFNGNYSKNDLLNVTFTANDGTVNSVNVTSSTNTISNSLPTASNVAITPAPAYTNTTLTGSYNYADADSDAESGSTYKWFKNQVVIAGQTTTTLSSSNFVKDDNITFEVTPNDGTGAGTSINSSVLTISNLMPSIPIITRPTEAFVYTNTSVIFDYNSTDADGDDITYYVFVDSVLNTTDTVGQSSTITFSDGNHNMSVIAGDGTVNSSESIVYNFSINTTAEISTFTVYGLNSNYAQIDLFNTSNLQNIEYMEFNFTLDNSIDTLRLNLTAGGTGACTLGNKQNSQCYTYNNGLWLHFQNNTNTSTYNALAGGSNQGDKILLSQNGNNYSIRIDEHYNPNVFKWYSALYNFSDVKWQEGADQKISQNNMIKIEVDSSFIPVTADEYKLDFRANYSTPSPAVPLQAYACNSSYTTGNPSILSECGLVAEKFPAQFQDDGTKFRGLFTKNLVSSLGNIKYIILRADINNPNRYYTIKTYKSLNTAHPEKWQYSTNTGVSWSNTTDNYETELNINWFYTGANFTKTWLRVWTNSTTGSEYTNANIDVNWSINTNFNIAPLVDIITPTNNESFTVPKLINFTILDTNLDNLDANLTLNNGSGIVKTLATGMNQSNTTFNYLGGLKGDFNLTLIACETGTADKFCANETHVIHILNSAPSTPSITYPGAYANLTSQSVNISYNSTDADGESLTYYLYVNGSLNTTSVGVANQTLILNDGSWSVFAIAFDGVVNSSNSTIVNFTIDSTAPTIVSTNTNTFPQNFSFNIILNENSNATLYYSTNSDLSNPSNVKSTTYKTNHTIDVTGLALTTQYFFKVNGTDTFGNKYATNLFNTTTVLGGSQNAHTGGGGDVQDFSIAENEINKTSQNNNGAFDSQTNERLLIFVAVFITLVTIIALTYLKK